MILQALADYYHRMKTVPFGFQKKNIHFVIVLNPNGSLANIQDMQIINGKRKSGRLFMVPSAQARTSNVSANLLWDNIEYALGELSEANELAAKKKGGDTKAEQERLKAKEEQFPAFTRRVEELSKTCSDDVGLKAVSNFLHSHVEEVKKNSHWEEIKKGGVNISFMLNGEATLVCERSAVIDAINGQNKVVADGEKRGTCLITGKNDVIARLHSSIKGVKGAQPSGANIVSFNHPSFCSFGKKQSYNSSIGKEAEDAYTKALNDLLKKESVQKMTIGDTTTVFWAEKENTLERSLSSIFGFTGNENEAANRKRAEYILALLKTPDSGHLPTPDSNTRFYVLGLAPNVSRLSVRFWYVGQVSEMESNLRTHFEDMAIVHSEKDDEYPKLRLLLESLALKGDVDKHLPPNLAGDWMRSILSGQPLPKTLLMAALRRIHAERKVGYQRASIIKGCLNRNVPYYSQHEMEVEVSLDESNLNVGYCIGRLFAVLERSQTRANPGLNATILDRFYGSASTTPVVAFPHLLKLNQHHLSKLENKGEACNLKKLIREIVDRISPAVFPAHLSLEDQGRFAIGYYHQTQAFFKKKNDLADNVEPKED